MERRKTRIHPLDLLLVFVPVALVLEWIHASAIWIFVASATAIIPLAGVMGRATEYLAARMGSGIGGLLNATFGSAAELINALMALREGLTDVVKASITGSNHRQHPSRPRSRRPLRRPQARAADLQPHLDRDRPRRSHPMDLVFSTFEVLAVSLAAAVATLVAMDGESNWMEGAQLLGVYLILAIASYFLP